MGGYYNVNHGEKGSSSVGGKGGVVKGIKVSTGLRN